MKLAEHIEQIRLIIDKAFRNRLGRMGITASAVLPAYTIPAEYREDRKRIESILQVFINETGTTTDGYEKLVEELSFTFFNRLAALKVIESHILHPEIVTRRSEYGDRSFSHRHWLEQNPDGRGEEQEGLVRFMEDQLAALAADIPLFSLHHPYHLLPTAIELNSIVNAFNQVEKDPQVEPGIWKSDDVLGWLYESYNNYKKAAHKASGAKTEFNKVSIQSQIYTPCWVVKFLVDNSLGKLYLEMFSDSEIKEKYKIANVPKTQTRERKPLTEIRLIDPAAGSGNYLLYAFDLFYDLYTDQIKNYGADYDENKIPELIMRYNLHGVDLDDRAVQLAQFGLYIKVKRKKCSVKIEHFNIVSSDFFLPDYKEVKQIFANGEKLNPELEKIVIDHWADLQQAYKFGSLIRLDEKFNSSLNQLIEKTKKEFGFIYEQFRKNFFANRQKAVAHNAEKQGFTFLHAKTADAITFLQLLTQKYDVAVANPPYTDSSKFGPELKKFVDANYKQPYKFNTNLYAAFIKRCCELIDDKGKIALIHPLTFMYIKSFEDVRKFIINKFHINILVEFGMGGLFPQNIFVDPTLYVLESQCCASSNSVFVSLDQYSNTFNQTKKKDFLFEAVDDFKKRITNKHLFTLDQSKLKIIEGWPFIYWISDEFRGKFSITPLGKVFCPKNGLQTGDNNRFLRFWWEITSTKFSNVTQQKWFIYSKGGPFNKWHGNLWLTVNWKETGNNVNNVREKGFFREGITFAGTGSKGTSFRYMPIGNVFDNDAPLLFPVGGYKNIEYCLGLLNSKLVAYVIDCLNPTVKTQVGDIKRIPFVFPNKHFEQTISTLSSQNIEIKIRLCSYRVIETNFDKTPLAAFSELTLRDRLLAYLNYENTQLTQVLLNEAIINQLVFEVYELSPEDREQVEAKMGKPVGKLPVLAEARDAYLSANTIENETVREFTQNLAITNFEDQQIQVIKAEFATLYQSNNDLEEFCVRHQLNPINVWHWFRESKMLPQGRASEISLEFLTDACRTILMEDEDGIIPLTGLSGKPCLLDRLEKHCIEQGFTSAQFRQLDGLLRCPIEEYIEHRFFDDLGNLLNLFRNLPKTPFIWHLTSGAHQGFEAYIIIYKWNQDSLFKLKSQYLSKRAESLEYRQIQLADSNTAQAQNEKEKVRLQLQEIAEFTKKIDELIEEGYAPKLDDGVGKNIAPLQKKGLLKSEVLKENQLKKYLKADW